METIRAEDLNLDPEEVLIVNCIFQFENLMNCIFFFLIFLK